MVPCTFRLLRKWSFSWVKAGFAWFSSLACIIGCIAWFQRQPLIQRETPIDFLLHHDPVKDVVKGILFAVLSIAMVLFPILMAFLTPKLLRVGRFRWNLLIILAASVAVTLFVAFYLHAIGHSVLGWLAPWAGSTLTARGVFDFRDIGERPTVLTGPVRALASLAVLSATASFVVCAFSRRQRSNFEEPGGMRIPTNRQLLILLGPFAAAYAAALMPRAADGGLIQRYTLPLVFTGLIWVIKIYQERVSASGLPFICVPCIAVFAFFSVAATHDFYVAERARLKAIDELLLSRIPPTTFYGGLDYDSWTQASVWGYVATPETNLPPGAKFPAAESYGQCVAWYSDFTPVIKAKFYVSYDDQVCGGPSRFAPVRYNTWLPPYSAFIYIRTVTTTPPPATTDSQ